MTDQMELEWRVKLIAFPYHERHKEEVLRRIQDDGFRDQLPRSHQLY
jgi:hypothetical protein